MDEKINKIIVFYDYKKDVPIFALVNYKIPIEEQEDDNDNDYKILVLKNTNVIKQIDLD